MTTLNTPYDPSGWPPSLTPLLTQLEGWATNLQAQPYLHINITEPYARYLLAVMLPKAVYVRMNGRVLRLEELERQIEAGLTSYARLLGDQPTGDYLIIDECDRISDDVVLSWLKNLQAARDPRRVVLMGRSTPIKLRRSPELRDAIAFIPHNISQAPTGQHALIVRGFGPGVVEVDGVRVETWTGHQPQLLFFFIMDRAIVTRDDVFRNFWPNMTPHEATNVFHVTKNKIARALGSGSQTDFTKYEGQFYRIASIWQISYDVNQFLTIIQSADGAADATTEEALLRQAEALYQGDYLSSFTEDWVIERRQKLRETMGDVLYRLASFAASRGELDEAYTYIMRSFQCDRRRPELLELALRTLPQIDRASDAVKMYDLVKDALPPDRAATLKTLVDGLR